jgi:CBS domain-containing protein
MICPACGHVNLMGSEACKHCLAALTVFDIPQPSNALENSIMTDTVEMLAPREAITLSARADLSTAMATMIERGVGAVLVTDEAERLVGILTERDFLTKIAGSDTFALLPIGQFMSRNPETVSPTDPLAFALRKMVVGSYRHIPVVVDDRPVGMISVRDVLRHVLAICVRGDQNYRDELLRDEDLP